MIQMKLMSIQANNGIVSHENVNVVTIRVDGRFLTFKWL